MTKTIIIDTEKQYKEKNIWWGDYPTIAVYSNGRRRKMRKTLWHYYKTWEEYLKHGYPQQKEVEKY